MRIGYRQKIFLALLLVSALGLVLIISDNQFLADEDPETIPYQTAPSLNARIEKLGPVSGTYHFNKATVVKKPSSDEYIQLLQSKPTAAEPMTLIALNTATGSSTNFGPFSTYQTWKYLTGSDGTVYIGCSLPSLVLGYNPTTNQTTNYGQAFNQAETVFSMADIPDKTDIALGGGGGEISLLNPNTKTFTKYGSVGTAGGYIYSLGADSNLIVGANRGNIWQLVTIDRTTRAQRILKEEPVEGYIDVRGRDSLGHVRVEITDNFRITPATAYKIVNGELVPVTSSDPPLPPGSSYSDYPDVTYNFNTIANDQLTVYYRTAKNRPVGGDDPNLSPAQNGWQQKNYLVKLEPQPINTVTRLDNGNLISTSRSYGTMTSYNLSQATGKILGFLPFNMIRPITDGQLMYMGGYPSAAFGVLKGGGEQKLTSSESIPGLPGAPWESDQANPQIIKYLTELLASGHSVNNLVRGADHKIYGDITRYRYDSGFGMFVYDPESHETVKIDDRGLFNHYQISWMIPIDNGRKIALSTKVQYDQEIGGPEPSDGKLFIYDITAKTFTTSVPLPGMKNLGQMVELATGDLVGLSPWVDGTATTVYRFNPRTQQTIKTRAYKGIISGPLDKGNLPRSGPDFKIAPDGWIWAIYPFPQADPPLAIIRFHPQTLGVEVLGILPNSNETRYIFDGNDMYFTGDSQLRRIKNIVPPAAKVSVVKSSPNQSVKPGSHITYEITVTNEGNATARQIIITDPLDPKTAFINASDGGIFDGQSVKWNIDSLPAGQSKILTLEVLLVGNL